MKTRVIGLSGPIASGKDEVCKVLRRRGAFVIDADEIGHKLLAPQSDVWRALVKAFGSKILMTGGKVNRKKLGEIVFKEPKLLKKLNSIMHPRMREEIKSEIRNPKFETNSKFERKSKFKTKLIVINAAMLKEMGLIPLVDEVWVVMADKGKRISRLMKAGLTRQQALARGAAQMKDRDYLKMADRVIRNDKTRAELKRSIIDHCI